MLSFLEEGCFIGEGKADDILDPPCVLYPVRNTVNSLYAVDFSAGKAFVSKSLLLGIVLTWSSSGNCVCVW